MKLMISIERVSHVGRFFGGFVEEIVGLDT